MKTADQEVKRLRTNRSKLFRTALREHLKRSRLKTDEERERAAYLKTPEGDTMVAFEKVTAWPVAPITSTIRGVRSEAPLGVEDPQPAVRRDRVGRRVARLSS